MLIGSILILSGIMIALFPPLLSLIIAALLISAGITVLSVGVRYKRMADRSKDPFMDVFTKI
ncbi:MAG: hypothetical protein ABIG55_03240 [Candidatus Omnitrophota bacterium]|nr:hypothetical protein [Candidatus Omnitrophota bacterium]